MSVPFSTYVCTYIYYHVYIHKRSINSLSTRKQAQNINLEKGANVGMLAGMKATLAVHFAAVRV